MDYYFYNKRVITKPVTLFSTTVQPCYTNLFILIFILLFHIIYYIFTANICYFFVRNFHIIGIILHFTFVTFTSTSLRIIFWIEKDCIYRELEMCFQHFNTYRILLCLFLFWSENIKLLHINSVIIINKTNI